jgi:hypothetical protein
MILGFASALNYLDYFLIIYRDRSHSGSQKKARPLNSAFGL